MLVASLGLWGIIRKVTFNNSSLIMTWKKRTFERLSADYESGRLTDKILTVCEHKLDGLKGQTGRSFRSPLFDLPFYSMDYPHWPLSFDRPLLTTFIFTIKRPFSHKHFEDTNFGFYVKTYFRVNA